MRGSGEGMKILGGGFKLEYLVGMVLASSVRPGDELTDGKWITRGEQIYKESYFPFPFPPPHLQKKKGNRQPSDLLFSSPKSFSSRR